VDISIWPLPLPFWVAPGMLSVACELVSWDRAETLQEAVVRGPDTVLLRD
jgi:hypothetical protein